jgi:hypothetical protein
MLDPVAVLLVIGLIGFSLIIGLGSLYAALENEPPRF